MKNPITHKDIHFSKKRITIVLIGIVIGMGLFIAKEAEMYSYMSDNPQACVNCHVMTPVYNSWMHNSHREWAVCNDCHVPHNNVVNKYFFKAKDGFLHGAIFTLRMEPEVIQMREESQEVVQENCLRCHTQQMTQPKLDNWALSHGPEDIGKKCWDCHREVPHGRVHGLSTIEYNIAPLPSQEAGEIRVPKWLQEKLNKEKKEKDEK